MFRNGHGGVRQPPGVRSTRPRAARCSSASPRRWLLTRTGSRKAARVSVTPASASAARTRSSSEGGGGVAEDVEVGAAAECLSELSAGALAHVVDDDDGEVMLALDVA